MPRFIQSIYTPISAQSSALYQAEKADLNPVCCIVGQIAIFVEMFKKTTTSLSFFCASLLCLLGSAPSAHADGVAPSKIGVVNLQAVIGNTKEGQQASQQLQKAFGARQKDFQTRGDELAKLNDQLKTGGALLSDDRRNQLTSDIAEKKRRLDRDIQDAQTDLNQQQQQVLARMEQKLRPIIDKYAKDNNFALVLDVGSSSAVVFASSAIDVTKDIIDLYDRANPVTVSAPEPSSSAAPQAPGQAAPQVPGQTAPRPAPGTPAHPPSR
ncbi:MAG TPA: OmpH family outer membrane protein [Bryobacteraceae bacterium]|nr:OmpH family outer membrane protein [Bryobacteraceae bacterium]